jgi:DNA-binding protein HU-beta
MAPNPIRIAALIGGRQSADRAVARILANGPYFGDSWIRTPPSSDPNDCAFRLPLITRTKHPLSHLCDRTFDYIHASDAAGSRECDFSTRNHCHPLTRKRTICYHPPAFDVGHTHFLGGTFMTKAELVEAVAAQSKLTKKSAADILDVVFTTIGKAVKKDSRFSYPGFGTWSIRTRKARKIRNPQTNELMKLKASKTVGFRPAKELKKTL